MNENPSEISLISKEFNLSGELSWDKNVKIEGRSGVTYTIDLVVMSKSDEKRRVAVIRSSSSDLVDDIMRFNAIAEDCGINLKAIIVNKELDKTEYNLAKMFNIVTIDDKKTRSVEKNSQKINVEDYSDAINELFGIDLEDYVAEYNLEEVGASGAKHTLDIVLVPKGSGRKVAFLVPGNREIVDEVMLFNSKTEDLNISLKGAFIDRDIDEKERRLLEIFNIRIIDIRKRRNLPKTVIGSTFGVEDIDKKIKGSLRKGSVYMISGKTGVGKTTMSLHFLTTGAKRGEKGAIVLTDTRPVEFVSNSSSFSLGFKEYYKAGMIEVFELSDEIKDMKQNVASNPNERKRLINKFVTEIRALVLNDKISRLVIDPITPALIEDDDFINTVINGLAIPDIITIVTSNVRANEFSFFGIEEYYCSGVIKLEFADANFDVRSLTILKLRGTSYDPSPLYYRITGDGIIPIQVGSNSSARKEESLFRQVENMPAN